MAYNPIKRLRSWFFDTNIPTEPRVYTDANGNSITKQVKTRLAKGHFAKEETFKDLLETTFMKSSGSDLQDVSSTQEIYDELNVEKVVKPNQLPELENTIDTITYIAQDNINLNYTDTFSGNIYTIDKRKHGGKNKYSWRFSKLFLGWLLTKLLPRGGSINQVLTKDNNSDFAVQWKDLPVANNGLPPFAGANRILFTNDLGTEAQWRNRDYYNQTEINGFRTADNSARLNGDALLQTQINNLGGGNNVKINIPPDNSEFNNSTLGYWKKGNQVFIEGECFVDNSQSVNTIIYTSNTPLEIRPVTTRKYPVVWYDSVSAGNDYKSGIITITQFGSITFSSSGNTPIFNTDTIYINITYLV